MGIALVTGASAGLGVEFAKLFAADGHSVVLVARRKDRMEKLAAELKQSHPDINTWVIDHDLSEISAGQKLFDKVSALGIQIDFLVNNAAFGSGGKFSDLPLDRELQMMDLNMRTLVETTRLFLSPMIARGSGRILNVSSVAGFQPGPYMNTYSATKAFVSSFTEGLYEELKGTGVTCTVLAPGYTVTEFQGAASIAGMKGSFNKATPAKVARDGYRAMMNGDAMKVSGFLNFLGAQSVRFAPRGLVRKIAAQMIKQQL